MYGTEIDIRYKRIAAILLKYWVIIALLYFLASCDCYYTGFPSGGCKIGEAPPKGYMCNCVYRGAWTCEGDPRKCTSPDIQPGCDGCLRKECCMGDCGGY